MQIKEAIEQFESLADMNPKPKSWQAAVQAYSEEIQAERDDATFLGGVRNRVKTELAGVDFGDNDE